MGIWIEVGKERKEVLPTNRKQFSLEELQKYVGGYIERIDLGDNLAMYVDEEGELKNLPINITATWILQGLRKLTFGTVIKGNAIIVDYREERQLWQ